MIMKKIIYYIVVSALVLATPLLSGCADDYLDTVPTDEISIETVGNDLDNLYLAINGMQRRLVSTSGSSQGQGGEPAFGYCRDAQSDDMEFNTLNNSWHRTLVRWTCQSDASSTYMKVPWMIEYKRVLNANLILSRVDNFSEGNTDLYRQVKGEALTFRAYAHFILVQCYAKRFVKGSDNSNPGVPYRTEPTTEPMVRTPVGEVYQHINEDLDEAIKLLDGITLKVDAVNHFNYASACGIKARVALAQQEYATAAEYADKALKYAESKGCILMTANNIKSCPTTPFWPNFTTSCKEAIWAATPNNDQGVGYYSFYAHMTWNMRAATNRYGLKCINKNLYNTMSATDARRCWWDPTGKMATEDEKYFVKRVYQNRKFTARAAGDGVGDYPFMRLAELYLIKAEGLARSGQDAKAQEILTAFQITRDPQYKSQGNTGNSLITEIMNTRRVELWGEGFSWLDHKRLGEDVDRRNSDFIESNCVEMYIPASDSRWQWFIPQAELDANNLLVQNP